MPPPGQRTAPRHRQRRDDRGKHNRFRAAAPARQDSVMSLPSDQQRALDQIEKTLADDHPSLGPLFTVFTGLTGHEAMPVTERITARPRWRQRRMRSAVVAVVGLAIATGALLALSLTLPSPPVCPSAVTPVAGVHTGSPDWTSALTTRSSTTCSRRCPGPTYDESRAWSGTSAQTPALATAKKASLGHSGRSPVTSATPEQPPAAILTDSPPPTAACAAATIRSSRAASRAAGALSIPVFDAVPQPPPVRNGGRPHARPDRRPDYLARVSGGADQPRRGRCPGPVPVRRARKVRRPSMRSPPAWRGCLRPRASAATPLECRVPVVCAVDQETVLTARAGVQGEAAWCRGDWLVRCRRGR